MLLERAGQTPEFGHERGDSLPLSPAALFVNVIARMSFPAPLASSKEATRRVITPGLARTRALPRRASAPSMWVSTSLELRGG